MSLCPPRYFVLYKKTNDQYVPGQLLRKNLSIIFLAWVNSGHFMTPLLVSPRNDVWGTGAETQYWRRVTTQIEDSASDWLTQIFPAARPIRGTSQIWAVPRRTRKIPTNRKRFISIGHEHSDPFLYLLCVIFFSFSWRVGKIASWKKMPWQAEEKRK